MYMFQNMYQLTPSPHAPPKNLYNSLKVNNLLY